MGDMKGFGGSWSFELSGCSHSLHLKATMALPGAWAGSASEYHSSQHL
jgi:hypothetical protein